MELPHVQRSYTVVRPTSINGSSSEIPYQPYPVLSMQGVGLSAALSQERERANFEQKRAEAAENRLLRSLAHFSELKSQVNFVTAARRGNIVITVIECRNELGEQAPWDPMFSTSPIQYLKAELKVSHSAAFLKRTSNQFDVVVPLTEGGSLGFKILEDLSIAEAHREDVRCREGDRIVAVDGALLASVNDLRASLKGKQDVTITIETTAPMVTILDPHSPVWEVASIMPGTSVEGDLKAGDLIISVDSQPVSAGLDPGRVFEGSAASVDFVPGSAAAAQRIRTEGLMSFTTKVRRLSVPKCESFYP